MLASIRVAPRLARGFLRRVTISRICPIMRNSADSSHLFAPPLLPQFRQRLPLFPEGDSRVRQRYGMEFPDGAASGSSTQMRLDVAWIRAGSGTWQAVAPSYPRLERIGVVVDVVDDEARCGSGCGGGRAGNRPEKPWCE